MYDWSLGKNAEFTNGGGPQGRGGTVPVGGKKNKLLPKKVLEKDGII